MSPAPWEHFPFLHPAVFWSPISSAISKVVYWHVRSLWRVNCWWRHRRGMFKEKNRQSRLWDQTTVLARKIAHPPSCRTPRQTGYKFKKWDIDKIRKFSDLLDLTLIVLGINQMKFLNPDKYKKTVKCCLLTTMGESVVCSHCNAPSTPPHWTFIHQLFQMYLIISQNLPCWST